MANWKLRWHGGVVGGEAESIVEVEALCGSCVSAICRVYKLNCGCRTIGVTVRDGIPECMFCGTVYALAE